MTEPLDYEAVRQQVNAVRAQTYDNMAVTQAHVAQAEDAASRASADRAAVAGMVQQTVTVDTSVGTRVFAGNTMIHGDTGWRDIASYLEPPWGLGHASSHAKMRRINDRVEFEAYLTWDQEEPVQVGMTMVLKTVELTGFRPPVFQLRGTAYVLGERSTLVIRSGTAADYLELADTHRDGVRTTITNGDRVYMRADWVTLQSWPTSLPGVPG